MLVGALAWGSCNASRASDATRQLQAALAAHTDSLHVWTATRHALTAELQGLRADSQVLAVRSQRAQRAAILATDSLGKLLARVPDSVRAAVESTVTVFSEVGSACQAQLANCSLRAANAERRAAGDSSQLAATQSLLDTVRVRWSQAERKAQPSWLRDIWRSRSVTLPLAAITTLLLLRR